MDNLPKNQSDEWSTFAGQYPQDKPATGTPPPAINSPSNSPPPPPISAPPKPVTSTQPMMTTVAADPFSPPPVSTPTTPVINAPPSSFGSTVTETASPPAPENNPFVVTADPTVPPPKKTNLRKLLVVLILIIILGAVGFAAFHLVGGFLTKNKSITLTYWGLWENEDLLKPIVTEYKKTHPNVDVVYSKQNPKQYRERLQAAIARGDGPDLFRFHNTWVPMLASDLAPAGKTGYTAADFQQTFYPVANKDLVSGGKVYGAPLMFDGLGLYYNEDLLRAAGVTPPTTWEEFRQAALSLTVKDQNGAIVTAGAALGTATNIEHFSDIVATMMLQNGADLKNPTGKEAQDALSFYHVFAEKPNNVWDDTLDNSILAFANGKVAMIFAPSWEVFTIRGINPNLKFQIIPIPQLPGTNVTWASYWVEGVSSKSKYPDEAWDFLKFLSSKEQLITLYTETTKDPQRLFGEPYSRLDLAQTIINDPYVGAYIRQAQTAQTFFLASRTYDNGIDDRMSKYLEDAVTSLDKGVSVDAALQTAGQGFSQVLKSFGSTTTAP